MLVNFADIQFDKYDRIETPTLVLKHMDSRVISTIGAYHSLSATFRYNDVSEISFEVPAKIEIEGKLVDNPYYDEVLGMRLVNVEPFGDFILSNPQVSNDGLKESKACKAYSLEYAFNKKQINMPTGTYNFYNPADNADTIMTIITEIVPDWSIGEVDRDLIGRWRTFDNIDDGLYSFMMNTLQKTYNCLFQFDCRNKKINVISADRKPIRSPIHLSYDNLIKSARITELSDEVITSLAGYGSGDNMSIAYVNPNGTDRIYNLDYLINHGDIEDKLADRWIAYRDSCDFYQKAFGNLEALRIEKTSAYMLAEAQLKIIEKDIKALEGSIISSKADTTVEGWEAHVKKLEADLAALKLKYEDQQAVVKKYNTDKEKVQTQLKEIMDICKLDAYFTEDELKTLSMFFKEDTIVEDSFVVPSYNSALKGDESSTITERSESMLKLTGTVVESSNIAEIVGTDENGNFVGVDTDNSINIADTDRHDQVETNEITQDIANSVAQQLNENKNKYVYSLRGGSLEFTQKVFTVKNGKEEVSDRLIKGSIVSASFQYNVDNLSSYVDEASPEITKKGYFLLTVALRNAYQNDVFYPSMNITLSGKIKGDAPQITDDFIGFNITTGTFYNTVGVTEFQQQQVYQELFDYVKDALKKLSEPSYQFSIDSANFVFAKTFEAFKNKLTLGKTISADINGDSDLETIVYPILIEVSFSYDDINNFSLTFSDKYKLSCPEFKFADLFGETVTSSKSLDLNKASYNSFVNSGASGAIDSLTNDAYDVAKKAIINSTNQGMEWNENGLYLRKKVNGGFDPEQIAMINNMIAFTGDGWDSVKLAIGKFKDTNVGDTWGIAAPNITGTLFAGKNLVIENTVTNKDGTKVVKQFKVDESGAWLNNSALYFAQDLIEGKTGGKMILDPMYGFAAGNKDLFAGEGKNIKPSFIGENGEMLYDTLYENKNPDGTMVKIQVPKNSSFFFNINNGNSYFKGDIYATNGYFAGTINAQNIIAGTLNGNVIQNGTINAGDKLTGDIQLPQMYKNVIEAVNECIKFQETVGGGKLVQINQAAIGNLNADKITAGDIATDRLTTNIIEAINGGKGLINADKVQAGSMVAGSLIISGENGRLAIDPKYGIVAGNRDIFQIGEDGKISTPTFVDETGNLIFDKDASAPKNASFYFDINTGKAYFSGKLSANDITTGSLTADVIQANVIKAINLSADKINVSQLVGDKAVITDAWIKDLSADKITAGTIGSDVIVSSVLKSLNASVGQINGKQLTFADGFIQSAWISNLTADKIKSGKILTNIVEVGSQDGGFLISGNTTQWTDKTGKVRLQAGQDKSGNFNFTVFGEDGKTAYFDEGGIHAEGIRDNILVDNMFKPINPDGSYQGISGDKLNISSTISHINKDGTTTINSGKILFNSNLNPIYEPELTPEGEPIKEPVTYVCYAYIKNEAGEIQYNEDGSPQLKKLTKQRLDKDGQPLMQIKYKIKIDTTGQPMYEPVLINGKEVYDVKLDEEEKPILDKNGEQVLEEEPRKQPVYIQKVDSNGNPQFETKPYTLDVFLNQLNTDFKGNIEQLSTNINIQAGKIETQVEELKQYKDDTAKEFNGINDKIKYNSSQISQNAEKINFQFTKINEFDPIIGNVKRYIDFSANGIEFGDTQNTQDVKNMPKIQLGTFPLSGYPEQGSAEGKLIFYSGATPVAWLTEQRLNVKNIDIKDRLYLGNFAFIPRNIGVNQGNLSFKKVRRG